ncbi:hypothetical protein LCGC14_1683750 [marine sediment metagenome]|uniref:Uncharacterized protein n=1 Tax=marine sediment metagenome TaxID=412755 RepID=A0A0F9HMZ7_9ZZZZ
MAKKRVVSKRVAKRDRTNSNGFASVIIPPLEQAESEVWLIGDRPLMVNNKLSVAEGIAEKYDKGPGAYVPPPAPTPEEAYANTFYVLPDSKYDAPHPKGRYGVPSSGIKKCACSAIRTTGITDSITIGLIGKSFWVMEDSGGLCLVQFKKLICDRRPVNIGSGVKTVPSMRQRPMFLDWKIKIRVKFNAKVLSREQIINLFMHAGQYIGLCEMRAEKKQGQCGGFHVRGAGGTL